MYIVAVNGVEPSPRKNKTSQRDSDRLFSAPLKVINHADAWSLNCRSGSPMAPRHLILNCLFRTLQGQGTEFESTQVVYGCVLRYYICAMSRSKVQVNRDIRCI